MIDALRKISRALGINIVLELGVSGYDGFYDHNTKTIHINANGIKPIDVIARHEIIHLLKREAPLEFARFNDFIKDKYIQTYGKDAYDSYIKGKVEQYKQKTGKDITPELADEELCADIGMDMLASAEHVREFVIKHRKLAERLLDCIKRVFRAIGRALGINKIDDYSVYDAYTALANATGMSELEVDSKAQMRRTYDVGYTSEAEAVFSALPGQLSLSDFAEGTRLLSLALDHVENALRKSSSSIRDVAKADMTLDEKRAALQKLAELRLKAEMDNDSFSFAGDDITLDDILDLRSIGRKSVNDFTSEDIKKTEPFARRAWRELGTKSPFFRAWFGDWRANDNTPLLVPVISPTAVISSGKELNRDMNRVISWSKDAAKESILNAPADVKKEVAVIGANMSEIVRTAVLLDTWVSNNPSKRKMDGSAFMHSLYTVVPMGDKNILIKLFAEEALSNDESTVFTRAYSLKYIEKVAEIDNGVLSENRGLTDSHSTTTISIADLFEFVKKYDKDFNPKPASAVVNDDGTPKIMYHGTNADENFTVFDTLGGNFGLFGIGAYFTDNREVAESYTSKGKGGNPRVYEVYLHANNLIDMDAVADKNMWISAVSDEDRTYFERYIKDDAISTNEDVFNALKELCEDNYMYREDAIEYITSVFMNMRYDGITHVGGGRYGKDNGIRHKVVIVFEPEQIKSVTDNIGTFNNENPDIMYSFSDANSIIDPDTESELFSVPDISAKVFSAQIDNWLSGNMKSSDLFEIGNTPAVLKALGASNLPVVMSQDVMAKITGEKHNISLDEIKQLPYAIADPIMVFKSATVDNAYIILTELTDKSGNDVVVAMHLNRFSGFNRINRISSVYGKYNIDNFVSSQMDAGNLKYADKKKSQEWLRSRGLQLPKLNTVLDSTDSILQKEDIVNTYFAQKSSEYSDDDIMFSFGGSAVLQTDSDFADESRLVIPEQSLVYVDSYRKLRKNDTFNLFFNAAKEGDVESAEFLAKIFITREFIEKWNDKYTNVTILPVLGDKAVSNNLVPEYLAKHIAAVTGCDYYDGIHKTTKNDFKHKGSDARISSSLGFEFSNSSADDIRGRHFVIFDDCISTGTTFMALREFVEKNGGIVDGFAALAKGIDHSDNIAITREQLKRLVELIGKSHTGELSRLTSRQAKALLKNEKLRNKLYSGNHDDNVYSFSDEYTGSDIDNDGDLQYNISKDDIRYSFTEGDTSTKQEELTINTEALSKHTAKSYNNYGWATVNNVLSGVEIDDFFSKFASIRTGVIFPRSKSDAFIIPVGEKFGVNNILIYAKGTLTNPIIEKIIRIDLDNEIELYFVREAIYEAESESSHLESKNVIRFIKERQIADISQFFRTDFRSFSELRSSKEFKAYGGSSRKENIRDFDKRNKRIQNNGSSGEYSDSDGLGIQAIQPGDQIDYSFSNEYIPKGENPARDVDVPAYDDEGRPVSRTIRTILEAEATPDTFVPGVLRELREGKFEREVITDKRAQDNTELIHKHFNI